LLEFRIGRERFLCDSYRAGLEEAHHITAKLVAIYNWVLRNKQHWMKYLYWAINRFDPMPIHFSTNAPSIMSPVFFSAGVRTLWSAFIR